MAFRRQRNLFFTVSGMFSLEEIFLFDSRFLDVSCIESRMQFRTSWVAWELLPFLVESERRVLPRRGSQVHDALVGHIRGTFLVVLAFISFPLSLFGLPQRRQRRSQEGLGDRGGSNQGTFSRSSRLPSAFPSPLLCRLWL